MPYSWIAVAVLAVLYARREWRIGGELAAAYLARRAARRAAEGSSLPDWMRQ